MRDKKNKPFWKWLIIGAVAAALIALILIIVLTQNNKNAESVSMVKSSDGATEIADKDELFLNDGETENTDIDYQVSEPGSDEESDITENAVGHIEGEYYAKSLSLNGSFETKEKWLKLDEGYSGERLFFKEIAGKGQITAVINEDATITVKYTDLKLRRAKTLIINEPSKKSSYTVSTDGEKLIITEKRDYNGGWKDGYMLMSVNDGEEYSGTDYYYEESIRAYELNSDLTQIIDISRKLEPKQFGIRYTKVDDFAQEAYVEYGDTKTEYKGGYDNYTIIGSQSTFLETEQEFCDYANNILKTEAIDWVEIARTSWDNRWYQVEIKETENADSMVKIDIACGESVESQNGSEFEARNRVYVDINAESEYQGKVAENSEDVHTSYDLQDEIESGDSNPVNITGTWVSDDERYIIAFEKQPSAFGISYSDGAVNADGQILFVDMDEYRSELKHGTYYWEDDKIIIHINLSDDKQMVLTPEDDMLISGEVRFNRTEIELSWQFEGIWENDYLRYEFDSDNDYKKDSSDLGYYFVISDHEIVMSKNSQDFKKYQYSISNGTLIIDDDKLTKTDGSYVSADMLIALRKKIVGEWQEDTLGLNGIAYKINDDYTWGRYFAYEGMPIGIYSTDLIEYGTYEFFGENGIRFNSEGGTYQEFYFENNSRLSGDSVDLIRRKD